MNVVQRQDRPDGITVVTLDRPDRLNTVTVDLVAELSAVLRAIDADSSVRVVVLTGAGRAFCAGLELRGYGDDDRVEREGPMWSTYGRQQDIAAVVQLMRDLRQPVIAAVNGAAAGAGLALVCAADVRIASTDAIFAGLVHHGRILRLRHRTVLDAASARGGRTRPRADVDGAPFRRRRGPPDRAPD
ncbi:enoyl-CoA hydratase/isomerase family protein [Aeromicrobium sp. UC242_57]|uniref:enoyl-CoA hydratase/isomerase family protein n=1 Tax=Aeromicrobium sp. UC242_57 TaxID=3374624 RepID=UPI00379811A5